MSERPAAFKYALITPAWNEEAHLPALIQSVAAQTIRPVCWVIVSDGSTDRTDAIVQAAATEHSWIRLLRRERDAKRHFAGKAQAVNAAYASLADLEFDLVGNLDADITLPPDFYEYLIGQFEADPRLGVAGAPFIEDAERPDEHSYNHRFAELSHVSGACQFFRRRCFDEVGGYSAVRQGGIDWIAVTSARMRGWTTRTFTGRKALHHRAMGTADRGVLRARFHHGQKDYLVGGHPAFQFMRAIFQMKNSPVVLGGLCLIAGYVTAWASRQPNTVPPELRAFHRGEQLDRLRRRVPFLRSRSANRGEAAETRS
jgi:glycosyltransferase involved in cell wall biosynthesis